VGAVVEPDAEDLLGIRDRRQQLELGQRQQLSLRALELGDAARPEQLAHALAATAQGIPGIEHPVIAQHARSGPDLGRIADQSHGRAG
jgi:hypothetical protein